MLNQIKKIVPKPFKRVYHFSLALFANFIYGRPSDKIIVIGITGTSGKSTTAWLISKTLEKAGYKVGVASTIQFKIDKKEWLNDKKMTMIGRFGLQKLIKQMVRANCQYAIVETTSEGIEQFRHLGINYDIVVFTNLYPEHIESHGSFANYKNAKLKLFKKLKTDRIKLIAGQKIKKTIVVNLDDEHSLDFLNNWADEKFGFTLENKVSNDSSDQARVIRAEKIEQTPAGINFSIEEQNFATKLYGRHNVYNFAAAMAVGISQGLQLSLMAKNVTDISNIPGRVEFIETGKDFKVIVDYAFEPKALQALYDIVKIIPHKRIIHVLGGTGGGRDKSRRAVNGKLVGSQADFVFITDEDPYDEDPMEIIDDVTAGVIEGGKVLNKTLLKVLDRREAINQALLLARKNDIVLITGKGSEQAMVAKGNKKIVWDDRTVVKEELAKI